MSYIPLQIDFESLYPSVMQSYMVLSQEKPLKNGSSGKIVSISKVSSSPKKANMVLRPKVCWAFAKYGECPKGTKCNLSHETPEEISSRGTLIGSRLPRKHKVNGLVRPLVSSARTVVSMTKGTGKVPVSPKAAPVSPKAAPKKWTFIKKGYNHGNLRQSVLDLMTLQFDDIALPITSSSSTGSRSVNVPTSSWGAVSKAQNKLSQVMYEKQMATSDISRIETSLQEKKTQYDKMKEEMIQLKASLATMELEMASSLDPTPSRVPTIIQPTPSNEQEFLPGKTKIVWNFNSCNSRCTTGMCVPQAYDSKTADTIENSYSLYKRTRNNTETPKFNIRIHPPSFNSPVDYEIDVFNMTQTNKSTGIVRGIERTIQTIREKNPAFRETTVAVGFQKQSFMDQFEEKVRFEDLRGNSDEFKVIEDQFLDSVSGTNPTMRSIGASIIKITRVVNPVSAKFYELKKELMTDKTEVMVFHGCRGVQDLTAIAKEGLDIRVSNGGYFGRALYGSHSSYYSHNNFTTTGYSGEGTMFYAKFLVGKSKTYLDYEQTNLVRPPTHNGVVYDSVRSDIDDALTTIRAVYDNSQCYISYMINYRIGGQSRPAHGLTVSQSAFSIIPDKK
ncbi:MAG: hypothetical protein PHG66_05570 [Candidatus Colwellbacteria bacterium]|nr:hypothetical protein [Candidatus Colwellbacteria bacterium]